MDEHEMATLLGDRRELRTHAGEAPFTVEVVDRGLRFIPRSGTPGPPALWHGSDATRYGVVELFADWQAVDRTTDRHWFDEQMNTEAAGTRKAPYLLATFLWLEQARTRN